MAVTNGVGYAAFRERIQTQPPLLNPDQRTAVRMGHYEGYQAIAIQLAPYSPDALTTQKQYKIYDDMLTDPAVRGPVNTKKTATLYKGIQLLPQASDLNDPNYGEAKEVRDHCQYVVDNIRTDWGAEQSFDEAMFEMLDGTFTGFKVGELLYRVMEDGPYSGKLGLQRIAAKPCKQISFRVDPQTLIPTAITEYTPQEGFDFDIPVEKVFHFCYMPRDGWPHGSPDGRACYKHWWRRDLFHKVWAIAIEAFGSPFIKATAPPGKGMSIIAEIIRKIRQGEPAVFPSNIEADLIELTGGGVAAIEKACMYDAHQIAHNILFQTLTTSEGDRVGSMALGTVHADTQEFGFGYTRELLATGITRQILRRLVTYNYGPEMAHLTPRVFLGEWDTTDQLKYGQAVGILLDRSVIHRTEPWIREDFGAPPVTQDIAGLLDEEAAEKAAVLARKPDTQGGAQNGQ